jgi:hypothetical protein
MQIIVSEESQGKILGRIYEHVKAVLRARQRDVLWLQWIRECAPSHDWLFE